METWLIPLLGGIGAAIIGLLTTLVVQWANRNKTAAEARSTDADYGVKVTASAVALINELQDEVKELRERQRVNDTERAEERKEMVTLRAELRTLKAEVVTLRAENETLRMEIAQLRREQEKPPHLPPRKTGSGPAGMPA